MIAGLKKILDPGSPGFWLANWDQHHCFFEPAWDIDNDGMDNACENALAQTFAPQLIVMRDCNYDYDFVRMGGEYFFAGEKKFKGEPGNGYWVARIAYLVSYYVDCGPVVDSKCDFVPPPWDVQCDPHSGDSEFIILDLRYNVNTTHWETEFVFLSKHCPSDDCRWYSANAFGYMDGHALGVPRVWVAEGKHAHYESLSACNSGGFLNMDTCEFNTTVHRIPIAYSQQNIGSRATPLTDCTGPFWGSPMTDPSKTECYWTVTNRFNGWQSTTFGNSPTPYSTILATYADF